MGTWSVGPFDSDDANDWAVEFDDARSSDRLALIQETFAAAIEPKSSDLDMDSCAAAIAAAATVAALVPGGPAVDEAYGPHTLGEPGFAVTAELRGQAVAALRAVLSPESEWSQLWAESGDLDEAKAVVDNLTTVLA